MWRGVGLVENAWGCPGCMAGGSRRRSRQSDKVKPLPCTLTEVFHATAAWRQNPTKTAGIAFQTGMPVDNVRPPVISITIIPSGLGPCTLPRYVPAYRQASFLPNPSSPRVIDSASQCILPSPAYPSGRDVRRVLSRPVRSRPSPSARPISNGQCTMAIWTLCVEVWV